MECWLARLWGMHMECLASKAVGYAHGVFG